MENAIQALPPVSRVGAILSANSETASEQPTPSATACTVDIEDDAFSTWSFLSELRRRFRTVREETYSASMRRTKRMRSSPSWGEDGALEIRQESGTPSAAVTVAVIVDDGTTALAAMTITPSSTVGEASTAAASSTTALDSSAAVASSSTPDSSAAAAATSSPAAPAYSTALGSVVGSSPGSSAAAAASSTTTPAVPAATTTSSETAAASASALASAFSSISSNSTTLSFTSTGSLLSSTSTLTGSISSSLASSLIDLSSSPTIPAYTSSGSIVSSTDSAAVSATTDSSSNTETTAIPSTGSDSSSLTQDAGSSTATGDASASGYGSYSGSFSATAASGSGFSGLAGTATSTGGAAASSTAVSGGGNTTDSGLSPVQQRVVGGVVGGLAGAAFILIGILMLLRWYKRNMRQDGRLALPSSEAAADHNEKGSGNPPATANTNRSQFSSHTLTPMASSAVAPAFFSKWRNSGQTFSTADTGDTGERGFQKLSGRKIPSVLAHGGDGYGGGLLAGPANSDPKTNSLSDSSFYRDSQGFYGGPGPHAASTMSSSDAGSTYDQRGSANFSPTSPTARNPFLPPSTIPEFPQPPPSPNHISQGTSPHLLSSVAGIFPSLAGKSALQNRGSTASEYAVIRPSPARTPMQFDSGNNTPQPMQSPDIPPSMPGNWNATPRGYFAPDAVGRTYYDGSRESRFSEKITP